MQVILGVIECGIRLTLVMLTTIRISNPLCIAKLVSIKGRIGKQEGISDSIANSSPIYSYQLLMGRVSPGALV